jgi:hypothetical protein
MPPAHSDRYRNGSSPDLFLANGSPPPAGYRFDVNISPRSLLANRTPRTDRATTPDATRPWEGRTRPYALLRPGGGSGVSRKTCVRPGNGQETACGRRSPTTAGAPPAQPAHPAAPASMVRSRSRRHWPASRGRFVRHEFAWIRTALIARTCSGMRSPARTTQAERVRTARYCKRLPADCRPLSSRFSFPQDLTPHIFRCQPRHNAPAFPERRPASPLHCQSSCDQANRTPRTDRATHLVLQAPGEGRTRPLASALRPIS